jgi:hypothetical protein
MWRKLILGAATLAVLGTSGVLGLSGVLAQPAPDRPNGPLFSREDAGAFLEARIAALHAGLQLTPEQERLWPAFEQAYRERGKLRIAGVMAGAPPAEDPVARLQRRADALLRQGAVLKRLADAAAPLWQSFDEGQKRRFTILARPFNQRIGAAFGRPDERLGAAPGPGRDGGRFGFDGGPRGSGRDFGPRAGPGGPGREGDERGGRGFGPGPGGTGPGGTAPGMGPRLRFGGPPGRDGGDFDYGRAPRGGEGGFARDPRDGRDSGRDFGRGQFRGWRGPPEMGSRRGDRRDGRDDGDERQ